MCDTIHYNNLDIGTVREFQDYYNVDATKYGYDGEPMMLDTCLCQVDLHKFFKERPDIKHEYDGDYWVDENAKIEPTL